MRIVTRAGPYLCAMPLAAGVVGDCRMCREDREVSADAIRAVQQGRGFEGLAIAAEWAQQIEGHSCAAMANQFAMPAIRGRWLSCRAEIGVYDPVLRADYRLPIARADCLAVGGTSDCPAAFVVYDTPGDDTEGRVAHYFLNRLDPDERRRLLSDLKEV